MSLNRMYFALAPNKFDISVVMKMKPKNILLSYALWSKKKKGKYQINKIVEMFWDNGYFPNVMLDSGAYSFRNDSQEHSFLSLIEPIVNDVYYNSFELSNEFKSYEECLMYHIELIRNNELDLYYYDSKLNTEKALKDYPNLLNYLDFISDNKKYINYIIALDDICNDKNSKDNWLITKLFFKNAIPTFHYGENTNLLDFYIENGAEYIGLGGVALAKLSGTRFNDIIHWINMCSLRFPTGKFHIFGCQDNRILNYTDVYSADGTSWIINAAKKHKKFGVTKFELACENIRLKEIS